MSEQGKVSSIRKQYENNTTNPEPPIFKKRSTSVMNNSTKTNNNESSSSSLNSSNNNSVTSTPTKNYNTILIDHNPNDTSSVVQHEKLSSESNNDNITLDENTNNETQKDDINENKPLDSTSPIISSPSSSSHSPHLPFFTTNITLLKPGKSNWHVISNSCILALYSQDSNDINLHDNQIIPNILTIWREKEIENDSFDIYLKTKISSYHLAYQTLSNHHNNLSQHQLNCFLMLKIVNNNQQFIGVHFVNEEEMTKTVQFLQLGIDNNKYRKKRRAKKNTTIVQEETDDLLFHLNGDTIINWDTNNLKEDFNNLLNECNESELNNISNEKIEELISKRVKSLELEMNAKISGYREFLVEQAKREILMHEKQMKFHQEQKNRWLQYLERLKTFKM
ncbi:hypothetical protein ABK040_007268 [Willaertia magna]